MPTTYTKLLGVEFWEHTFLLYNEVEMKFKLIKPVGVWVQQNWCLDVHRKIYSSLSTKQKLLWFPGNPAASSVPHVGSLLPGPGHSWGSGSAWQPSSCLDPTKHLHVSLALMTHQVSTFPRLSRGFPSAHPPAKFLVILEGGSISLPFPARAPLKFTHRIWSILLPQPPSLLHLPSWSDFPWWWEGAGAALLHGEVSGLFLFSPEAYSLPCRGFLWCQILFPQKLVCCGFCFPETRELAQLWSCIWASDPFSDYVAASSCPEWLISGESREGEQLRSPGQPEGGLAGAELLTSGSSLFV